VSNIEPSLLDLSEKTGINIHMNFLKGLHILQGFKLH